MTDKKLQSIAEGFFKRNSVVNTIYIVEGHVFIGKSFAITHSNKVDAKIFEAVRPVKKTTKKTKSKTNGANPV